MQRNDPREWQDWFQKEKSAVADLGEAPPPTLILAKQEEMTEGKMADRASKSRHPPPPPPLAQCLDQDEHIEDNFPAQHFQNAF